MRSFFESNTDFCYFVAFWFLLSFMIILLFNVWSLREEVQKLTDKISVLNSQMFAVLRNNEKQTTEKGGEG